MIANEDGCQNEIPKRQIRSIGEPRITALEISPRMPDQPNRPDPDNTKTSARIPVQSPKR